MHTYLLTYLYTHLLHTHIHIYYIHAYMHIYSYIHTHIHTYKNSKDNTELSFMGETVHSSASQTIIKAETKFAVEPLPSEDHEKGNTHAVGAGEYSTMSSTRVSVGNEVSSGGNRATSILEYSKTTTLSNPMDISLSSFENTAIIRQEEVISRTLSDVHMALSTSEDERLPTTPQPRKSASERTGPLILGGDQSASDSQTDTPTLQIDKDPVVVWILNLHVHV